MCVELLSVHSIFSIRFIQAELFCVQNSRYSPIRKHHIVEAGSTFKIPGFAKNTMMDSTTIESQQIAGMCYNSYSLYYNIAIGRILSLRRILLLFILGKSSGNPNGLSRKARKREKSKRTIDQKQFAGQVKCVCKLNCAEKIDILRQQQIFHDYRVKSWINRLRFLRKIIVARRNDKENINPIIPVKEKKFSYNYFLADDEGQKQEVCHAFVRKLLQISKIKLFRTAQSMITNPNADNRRGNKRLRAVSYDDTQHLKRFIASFPQFESRFNVIHERTKFLHPRLNLERLFRLYREKCTFQERKPVSLTHFRKFFKHEFTLSFFKPKTSVCYKCKTNSLDMNRAIVSARRKAELLQSHEGHTSLITHTITQHRQIVQTAQCMSENIEVLTFGLGNSIDLPYIKASEDFQKRKLWVHQFCIFDEVRRKHTIYVWPESTASKGSQEIGCCLLRYLHDNLPSETDQLILYSDPCYGQNRNIKLVLILQMFLQSHANLKNIDQRFFLPGHSYNSTDKFFKLIESQRKSSEVLLNTSHVIGMIEKAKKPQIVVTEMLKEHFLSTKPLESLIHSKNYTNEDKKIRWSEYERITHYRDNPLTPKVTVFNNRPNQSDLPLKKMGVEVNLSNIQLPLLFPIGRYISKKKFDDLQAHLKYFDADFHSFYKDLKFAQGKNDQDFVLSARESSDEEEEFEAG